MDIYRNLRSIWEPVMKKMSISKASKTTKKVSISFFFAFIYLPGIIYYGVTKPEKVTETLSKTAEKISKVKIPKIMRKKLFTSYSKYYGVKLDQITQPLTHFQNFSEFFTRKVKPREIVDIPGEILSPADSKVLKISEIRNDQNAIIKGASYSLGELITGEKVVLTPQQIDNLKKNKENRLYQVILYLGPGDYHRFHSPVDYQVSIRKQIEGAYWSVSEKTLAKKHKVYQKNKRLCLHGTWSEGYLGMVMVGALNVGNIIINTTNNYLKGDELGYFNLGSTIVMHFESKNVPQWSVAEGQKVRYGQPLCKSH